jgi:hypothetical protein
MRSNDPVTSDEGLRLPHVDEHEVVLSLPIDEAWNAVHDTVKRSFLLSDGRSLVRLLGPEPPEGFGTEEEVRPTRLVLRGRHHFSDYRLSFVLEPLGPSNTRVRAITDAEFPGWQGATYRALVIGSGAHARIMRRILRRLRDQHPATS